MRASSNEEFFTKPKLINMEKAVGGERSLD